MMLSVVLIDRIDAYILHMQLSTCVCEIAFHFYLYCFQHKYCRLRCVSPLLLDMKDSMCSSWDFVRLNIIIIVYRHKTQIEPCIYK